jgi:beta-glucosidase
MYCRYMDPLTSGDYPSSMRSLVGSRLPKFSTYQVKLVKGSFDFIGLNYYTSHYATNAPELSEVIKPSYNTDALVSFTSKCV